MPTATVRRGIAASDDRKRGTPPDCELRGHGLQRALNVESGYVLMPSMVRYSEPVLRISARAARTLKTTTWSSFATRALLRYSTRTLNACGTRPNGRLILSRQLGRDWLGLRIRLHLLSPELRRPDFSPFSLVKVLLCEQSQPQRLPSGEFRLKWSCQRSGRQNLVKGRAKCRIITTPDGISRWRS